MCAPFVMSSVREGLSRRGFLGAAVGCAAVASVNAQQQPVRLPKGFRDVIDLTHAFSPALPVYPGYKPVQIRARFSIAQDGFAANEVTFDEHTGTHVDAPAHFVAGGVSAGRLPVDRLVAPLVVVRIGDRAARDPDTLVTPNDILEWENVTGVSRPERSWRCMPAGTPVSATSIDSSTGMRKGRCTRPVSAKSRRAFSSASATSALWGSIR